MSQRPNSIAVLIFLLILTIAWAAVVLVPVIFPPPKTEPPITLRCLCEYNGHQIRYIITPASSKLQPPPPRLQKDSAPPETKPIPGKK